MGTRYISPYTGETKENAAKFIAEQEQAEELLPAGNGGRGGNWTAEQIEGSARINAEL